VKTLPISAWEKEYATLKANRKTEYEKLENTRAEVTELQNIRHCVDIVERAEQLQRTQTLTKNHDMER
jgi:hypothetical protein